MAQLLMSNGQFGELRPRKEVAAETQAPEESSHSWFPGPGFPH